MIETARSIEVDPSPAPDALPALVQVLGEFVLLLDPDGTMESLWILGDFPVSPACPRGSDGVLRGLLDTDQYESLRIVLRRVAKGGRPEEYAFPILRNGEEHRFSVRVGPVTRPGDGLKAACLLAQNVTQRKTVADRLHRSETLLLQAVQLADLGVWDHDLKSGSLLWSDEVYRQLGLTPGEVNPAFPLFEAIVHPQDRERVMREHSRCVAARIPFESEFRCVLPDGGIRVLHSRGMPCCDESGQAARMIGTSQDITARMDKEQRLRRSEALLAQAEQLANLGSWEYNIERQSFVWSDHFYRMLGLVPGPRHVPLAEACRTLHPDDREPVCRAAETLLSGAQSFENEARFVLPDGRTRIFHSRGIAVLDQTGAVRSIRGMSQDVTERKNEEDRLRKSEALLAQAEEIADLGSWEFDLKTRRSVLSSQLFRLFAADPDTPFTEEQYWGMVHPSDRERAQQISERAVNEARPYEYIARCRRADGRVRTHITRGLPVVGPGGHVDRIIGVVQDITEQARSEEVLRRLSQKLLRARDEERRHTARELHESAGQTLAALKMTMARIREALPGRAARARSLLDSSVQLAEAAIREIRTVSYLMHPPMLDEAGLDSALRWYVRGFSERSGISVSINLPDAPDRYPQEVETTVFRIVQESLTNVHRYSGSRTAQITLARCNAGIRVEICDQGCGITASAPAGDWRAPLGVGIAGMRERVENLNGTFEIQSAPGRGATVRAVLPLRKDTSGSASLAAPGNMPCKQSLIAS